MNVLEPVTGGLYHVARCDPVARVPAGLQARELGLPLLVTATPNKETGALLWSLSLKPKLAFQAASSGSIKCLCPGLVALVITFLKRRWLWLVWSTSGCSGFGAPATVLSVAQSPYRLDCPQSMLAMILFFSLSEFLAAHPSHHSPEYSCLHLRDQSLRDGPYSARNSKRYSQPATTWLTRRRIIPSIPCLFHEPLKFNHSS
jgi:hypothetical protein